MKLENRAILVTGGAGGVASAMVERFALEAPRGIAVVDRDADAARAAADRVGGLAIVADLTCEAEALRVIGEAEARYGPIDLCCSNGGIATPVGGFEAPDGEREHWNIAALLYRGPGQRLSCLRPFGAEKPGGNGVDDAVRRALAAARRVLDPAAVADIVVEALRVERFLVLTRPERKERAVVRVTHPDACVEGLSDRYASRCSAILGRDGARWS